MSDAARRSLPMTAACAIAAAFASACSGSRASPTARSSRYEDLIALFTEWRAFQQPKLVNGVPDYTATAMAAQQRELPSVPAPPRGDRSERLADRPAGRLAHRPGGDERTGLRPSRPEAVGRRIRRSTSRCFRTAAISRRARVRSRDGARGDLELCVSADAGQGRTDGRRRSGRFRGCWIRRRRTWSATPEISGCSARGASGARAATWRSSHRASVTPRAASRRTFNARRTQPTPSRPGSTRRPRPGPGPPESASDNYNWYLQNVQLVPLTWQDEVTLMERELARAHAFLALEEQRNAKLPAQVPLASQEEHSRRFNAAVTEYMAFLKDHDILTIRDYMDPALRARIGRFSPGPREFFTRSRLPRSRSDAHARVSLVRSGADGTGSPIPARCGAARCCTTSSSPARRGTQPAGKK